MYKISTTVLQERNLRFVHAVLLRLKSVFFSPIATLLLEIISRPVHTERQPLRHRQVFLTQCIATSVVTNEWVLLSISPPI